METTKKSAINVMAQAQEATKKAQDAKKAAKSKKGTAEAKAKAEEAKKAAQAAREAAINAITATTEKAARQSFSLSAQVTAAIIAAKQAGIESAAACLIAEIIERGEGAGIDWATEEATKAERAAYIRGLRALWTTIAKAEGETPAALMEAKVYGAYLDKEGKRVAVYTFTPVDKWTAAKVVRRPLLAILRGEGQRTVDAAKYYADSKGAKALTHKTTIERDCAAYAAQKAAKAEAAKAKAAQDAEKAKAYDRLKAQASEAMAAAEKAAAEFEAAKEAKAEAEKAGK